MKNTNETKEFLTGLKMVKDLKIGDTWQHDRPQARKIVQTVLEFSASPEFIRLHVSTKSGKKFYRLKPYTLVRCAN